MGFGTVQLHECRHIKLARQLRDIVPCTVWDNWTECELVLSFITFKRRQIFLQSISIKIWHMNYINLFNLCSACSALLKEDSGFKLDLSTWILHVLSAWALWLPPAVQKHAGLLTVKPEWSLLLLCCCCCCCCCCVSLWVNPVINWQLVQGSPESAGIDFSSPRTCKEWAVAGKRWIYSLFSIKRKYFDFTSFSEIGTKLHV